VVAIALRDGKRLWTRSLHLADINLGGPIVAVGDLDRDGRCEVVVTHYPRGLLVAEALEGRDGTSRWSWSRRTKQQPNPYYHPSLRLADLDGDGSKEEPTNRRTALWYRPVLPAPTRDGRDPCHGRLGQVGL
jgi:hypothetical protein